MAVDNNKAILQNTIILYTKLLITSVCGLFTTRFALKALGATDFGLFSVVGGVISFIAIFNTIMLSTSNRFIAAAIGKKDAEEVNKTFNVNLVIHVCIAVVTLLLAIPLGDWYIVNYVNFDGDINVAVKIFNITIIGSVISFIGVPYNGLLIATERFFVFCTTEALSSILKMLGALSLLYCFEDKLMVYTIVLTVLSAYPTLVFWRYCKRKFPKYTQVCFVKEKARYKEVFGFSVWVGCGAVASIGKAQGTALILNAFFNTLMNTALGLANSIKSLVQLIATSMTKSISPQITKTYSAGNMLRCEHLVIFASKVTFLSVLMVSFPFFLAPEWLLGLWLGEVPDYTILFMQLILIESLIKALNGGIPEVVFASGKLKWYQIIESSWLLLSVVVSGFVLYLGAPAYMMFVVLIIFSAVMLIIRQILLNKIVKFNNWRLIKESFVPSLSVLVLSLPLLLLDFHPVTNIILSLIWIMGGIYFVGLNKNERAKMNTMLIMVTSRIGHKLVGH